VPNRAQGYDKDNGKGYQGEQILSRAADAVDLAGFQCGTLRGFHNELPAILHVCDEDLSAD
jgi:hypothetical protein